MLRNVLVTALLTVVALLPALLIYSLFPQNQASVTWGGQAVKLGGPIAAFVGFFLILTNFYNRLALKNANLTPLVEEKVRPLAGVWEIEAVSRGASKDRRRSEVMLETTSTGITLGGGTFETAGPGSGAGELIGQWECDAAFSDGKRLFYIYEVTETGPAGRRSRGIVNAVLQGSDCFKGTWETIGSEYHSGTIVLKKRKEQPPP